MLSSTAGGTAAIAAVNDDHVDDSTKDEDDDDETAASNNNANGIVAIRHRGGYSLSKTTMTTTFMPILFIIQLYTFLQVGFWGMVGV